MTKEHAIDSCDADALIIQLYVITVSHSHPVMLEPSFTADCRVYLPFTAFAGLKWAQRTVYVCYTASSKLGFLKANSRGFVCLLDGNMTRPVLNSLETPSIV